METFKNRSGFTLLEVMVALAVIGIALVALLTTQSTSIKIITRSTLITKSYLLGEKKLAALELAGYDAVSDGEGSFEDNPELRWVQTISEKEIDGLKEVHLRIISGEPEQERREAHFVTFVAQMEEAEEEDE